MKEKTHVGKYSGAAGSTALRRVHLRSWMYPMVAALLVALTGTIALRTLERTLDSDLSQDMSAFLQGKVLALRIWLAAQKNSVRAAARDPRVRAAAAAILTDASAEGVSAEDLRKSAALATLRKILAPVLTDGRYAGFAVLDSRGRIVAALNDVAIDLIVDPETARRYLSRLLDGQTVVTHPFRLRPRPRAGRAPENSRIERLLKGLEPTMFAAQALREEDGTRGILAFGIHPDEFTRILEAGRVGESGETYAFDREGVMLSHSRFDEELRKAGLLPEDAGTSVLRVQVRNPYGAKSRSPQAWPLTEMAAEAVGGRSGVNVEGYRDYRGIPVVGAWTWLDDYDCGVAFELDRKEALKNLGVLRRAFWGLFGLLVLSAIAIFVYSRYSYLLKARLGKFQRLGQYTLLEKIGEGGMGQVYRASHAMLQRPTAVKLLRPEIASAEKIARFEREVQLTSRLAHPNTIAVYDYGRTADGVFYYAMEYLRGYTLFDLLVTETRLPAARIIHILRQTCGSLGEAHDAGLIHRDIKPTNIMVCERGGIPDMVKVLDFGLVKDIEKPGDTAITRVGILTGTPLYMAPESIHNAKNVDARSDIYALGAVAYQLLCGELVFDGDSVVEVCTRHVSEQPVPPSERLGEPVSPAFEAIILQCLEKDPEKRPQTVHELLRLLDAVRDAGSWGEEEARAWWRSHPPVGDGDGAGDGQAPPPPTSGNLARISKLETRRLGDGTL